MHTSHFTLSPCSRHPREWMRPISPLQLGSQARISPSSCLQRVRELTYLQNNAASCHGCRGSACLARSHRVGDRCSFSVAIPTCSTSRIAARQACRLCYRPCYALDETVGTLDTRTIPCSDTTALILALAGHRSTSSLSPGVTATAETEIRPSPIRPCD